MEAGQAANHSHTAEWVKVMCGHVYGKVSEAPPQLRGLGTTESVCVCVCVGFI